MSLFSRLFGRKCSKFFHYKTNTLNLKGLKADIKGIDVGLGELSIDPKNVEVTDELKRLDLLQFSICKDIQNVKNDAQRDELLKKSAEVKLRMLDIATNYNQNKQDNTTGENPEKKKPVVDLPVLLVDFNVEKYRFVLGKNEDLAFFIEKAEFLLRKGSDFCLVEISGEEQLRKRKTALDQQKEIAAQKELLELMRCLECLDEFKQVMTEKIKILLTIRIPYVYSSNRFTRLAEILEKIVNGHRITSIGLGQFPAHVDEGKTGTTKLDVYQNLKDHNNERYQLGISIYANNEEMESMRLKYEVDMDMDLFRDSLRFPGNYFITDLLNQEIVFSKVVPEYVRELHLFYTKAPAEVVAKNREKCENLPDFFVGLG